MTLPAEALGCDRRGVVVRSTALADALAGAPLVGRSLVEIAGAADAARVGVFIAWSARSSEARPARLVVRARGGRDAELTGRRAGLDADAIAIVHAVIRHSSADWWGISRTELLDDRPGDHPVAAGTARGRSLPADGLTDRSSSAPPLAVGSDAARRCRGHPEGLP